MPKLPRGTDKATTKERAKKPATKAAPASKSSTAKKASGSSSASATKKKPAPTRSNGGRATKAKSKAAERDFRHRPVDRHEQHAPAGPKAKLTDDQRVLLGDLFAVMEEHAGE
jgi:hypothetical protein